MPKGKRGRGTMQNGGIVQVEWSGKILIGGPRRLETEIRERLEDKIRRKLEECDVFAASGLAAEYAFKIAWGVTYQQRDRARSKRTGRFVKVEPVIKILELDVIYRNPPKSDKWWVRLRNGKNTIEPGWWVGQEEDD